MSIDRLTGALAALRAEVARGAQPASVDLADLRAVVVAYEAIDRALWVAGDAAVEAERSARVALADADLIMKQRERQLTAALTALADERARCATVCREVAAQHWATGVGGAAECAEAIEREPLDIQRFEK
jgi:hypothetical protein